MIAISTKASSTNVRAASRLAILVVALAAVVAFPAFAGAQTISPTDAQYGNALQEVSQGEVPETPPAPVCVPDSSASADSSGADVCAPPSAGLPFTGLDVVGLGAVALLLTLGGVALRRARFAETTET